MSLQVNTPNSGHAAATNAVKNVGTNHHHKQKVQKKHSWGQSPRGRFMAALLGNGVFIPILLLIMTIGFYIATSGVSPYIDNWIPLSGGMLSTIIIWLIITFCNRSSATAENANPQSYAQLMRGLMDLRVHLGLDSLSSDKPPTLEEMKNAAHMDETNGARNVIALQKAHAYYKQLGILLTDPVDSVGFQWVMGMGYINGWSMLHRAQEALIEVDPLDEILRGAMHDKRSLEGSNVPDEKMLLDRLAKAIKHLDPQSITYFEEDRDIEAVHALKSHFTEQDKVLGQIITAMKQQQPTVEIDFSEDNLHKKPTQSPDIDAMHRARVALREVRQVVNGFRDTTWERLLRGRNRLMGAILLTGLVTYTMLCITLLTNTRYGTIVAAADFYTIGAVAGLFGQFYQESTNPTMVDDFGLSLVRLIATPLLSGLAGLGGVFISAALTTINYQTNYQLSIQAAYQPNLQDIFSPTPEYLLIAAVFGLTPYLLIKSLQQRAAQYAEDLQSSKGSSQQ